MNKLKKDPWGHHVRWIRADFRPKAILIGIPILFLLVTNQALEFLGISFTNLNQQIQLGFLLGCMAFVIAFLFQLKGPVIPDYEQDIKASLLFSGYLFFVNAFAEELFFRGFLQTLVNQLFGNSVIAILLSTAIFAYYHKWLAKWNWFQVILAFVAGLAFAIVFHLTNSLIAVWLVHAFIDLGYINECLPGYYIFTRIRHKEIEA